MMSKFCNHCIKNENSIQYLKNVLFKLLSSGNFLILKYISTTHIKFIFLKIKNCIKTFLTMNQNTKIVSLKLLYLRTTILKII